MQLNRSNPLLAAATVAAIVITLNSVRAADLTWDTFPGDEAAITAGSGVWDTNGTNLLWNNGTTNVPWTQTSTTDASNAAIFAGADGTPNQYVVTLGAQMAAESITFNSSGYQITGSTLALMPTTTTNGAITVAANKTATINSTITYSNNKQADITVNSGSTLNLGGGASNSQYRFAGAGTVNMTAGTYTANVGFMNAATFNQTGGTFNMTLPAGNDRFSIGINAGRSVSYTLSGGTINSNSNADANANSLLAIGRTHANTAFTNTLNVQGSGILNVGTTTNRAGELHIAGTGDSNGTLNVTGGTVTVGTGKTDNRIYFFKAGSNSGYTAAHSRQVKARIPDSTGD